MSSSRWQDTAEALALPLLALAAGLGLFGVFVWLHGHNPLQAWTLLFLGAFGDSFSIQNTLQRAAPLMLTALCVAIPARAGLMIIGGEGALVLGGLAAAALPYAVPLPAGSAGTAMLLLAAALAGAVWIALAGWLRQWRGVNETISSLLLGYLAIALFKHGVEGALRDPASLNKPSTLPLAEDLLRQARRSGIEAPAACAAAREHLDFFARRLPAPDEAGWVDALFPTPGTLAGYLEGRQLDVVFACTRLRI